MTDLELSRRFRRACPAECSCQRVNMISFDDGAMTFPEEELPAEAEAAGAVRKEATDAGVWVFSAGLLHQVPSVVATDAAVYAMPLTQSRRSIGRSTGTRRRR